MASTVGKLAFTVAANTSNFFKKMGGVKRYVQRLGGSAGKLGKMFAGAALSLRGFGVALGTGALGTLLMKRGGQLEVVQKNFNALSKTIGSTGTAFAAKLREATKGSVADYDLMLTANDAMLLGVGKSDEQFSKLASSAMRLGAAVGRTATQSIDDITRGIGRMQPLILDNLGIHLKLSAAYDRYAKSIGKTSGTLTEAEKKQAFFNETLRVVDEKLKTLPDNTGFAMDSFNRLGATIKNIIDKVMIPLAKAIQPLAEGIRAMLESIPQEEVSKFVGKWATLIMKWLFKAGGAVVDFGFKAVAMFKRVHQEMLSFFLSMTKIAAQKSVWNLLGIEIDNMGIGALAELSVQFKKEIASLKKDAEEYEKIWDEGRYAKKAEKFFMDHGGRAHASSGVRRFSPPYANPTDMMAPFDLSGLVKGSDEATVKNTEAINNCTKVFSGWKHGGMGVLVQDFDKKNQQNLSLSNRRAMGRSMIVEIESDRTRHRAGDYDREQFNVLKKIETNTRNNGPGEARAQ